VTPRTLTEIADAIRDLSLATGAARITLDFASHAAATAFARALRAAHTLHSDGRAPVRCVVTGAVTEVRK
jgi:hypothetical protein